MIKSPLQIQATGAAGPHPLLLLLSLLSNHIKMVNVKFCVFADGLNFKPRLGTIVCVKL